MIWKCHVEKNIVKVHHGYFVCRYHILVKWFVLFYQESENGVENALSYNFLSLQTCKIFHLHIINKWTN